MFIWEQLNKFSGNCRVFIKESLVYKGALLGTVINPQKDILVLEARGWDFSEVDQFFPVLIFAHFEDFQVSKREKQYFCLIFEIWVITNLFSSENL